MNKYLITSIIFLGMALSANAQEPAVAVSNHSISVDIPGLEYGYEQALGGSWTIIGRVGFAPMVTEASYNKKGFHVLTEAKPAVSLESRYYTTLGRRARHGRSTENNSSNFLMLRYSAANVFSNTAPYQAKIIFAYGIRRSGRHFFVEPTAGIGYQGYPDIVLPHTQVRLGFVF